MIFRPIIPLVLMIIISIILIVLVVITSKRLKLIVRLLIIGLLFMINLRPMLPDGNVEVVSNNFDIVFVVDTTLSMEASDYNGSKTRLSGVKKDIDYIVNKLPGAYYAVVSFDNDALMKVPFTFDSNAIMASVDTLKVPNTYGARGSNITNFKEPLEMLLKKSRKKEGRSTIVFLFTDGENTSEEKMDSLNDLEELIDGGAVLGYGTTKGATMEVIAYGDTKEKVQDRSSYPYKDAISKMDEKNLKKMASDMGIEYIHMTSTKNIDSTLNNLNKVRSKADSAIEESYTDLYFYITPFLLILFLVEISLDRRDRL